MASELSRLSGYYDRKTANDMDYREYMGKQAMVKDIGTAIQRSTDQQMIMTAMTGIKISDRIDQSAERLENSMVRMQTGIQTSIKAQTLAIVASQAALAYTFNKGFDKINNTLDMGFAGVSDQLGAMTASFSMGLASLEKNIDKMNKDICDRLDALHDIMNNPLLTQSRELYRRAVTNYNKGFFEEALTDVQSAVEKNKTDYISWFHQGKVYLFGASEFSNVIDLDKAIEALTQAAKYNKPDITESDDARLMAAEIWFYLGLSKYSKFNDLYFNKKETEAKEFIAGAAEAFERSYSFSKNMLESHYNAARCYTILKNTNKAIQYLEEIILTDRTYCIKVFADSDFEPMTKEIEALIIKLKNNIYGDAKRFYDHINIQLNKINELNGVLSRNQLDFLSENLPDEFSPDSPYFDVQNGHEIFPYIISELNSTIAELNKEKEAEKIAAEAKKAKAEAAKEATKAEEEIYAKIAEYKQMLNVKKFSKNMKNDIHRLNAEYMGIRDFEENKSVPRYHIAIPKSWQTVLKNNASLCKELRQVTLEASNHYDKLSKNKAKLTVATVSMPVSFIFFILIFVSQSVSIVWGSVIVLGIIFELAAIARTIYGITSEKISEIFTYPIVGAIAGLIVGGVAWILSSFGTFTTVLWVIVILFANFIAISQFAGGEIT
jgi:uncharacterized membrane protein